MNWVSPFPENKPYVVMAKVNYIWLIADFQVCSTTFSHPSHGWIFLSRNSWVVYVVCVAHLCPIGEILVPVNGVLLEGSWAPYSWPCPFCWLRHWFPCLAPGVTKSPLLCFLPQMPEISSPWYLHPDFLCCVEICLSPFTVTLMSFTNKKHIVNILYWFHRETHLFYLFMG